jgi:hypothetical protein
MVMSAADGGGGEVLPPDLELNAADAAKSAALTTKDSYDVTLKLPLTRANKVFSFWFNYVYQDPETNILTEGPRSPIVEHGFDVPNLTKGVLNLTLTQGFKSYGVKFTLDPTSIQEDIVIFESLTGAFAGEQYIVYVGNSTNVTINTSDFAPRWVMVRARDKWLDANKSDVTAGPVTPKNADPDTSTPPAAPSTASVVGSIDSNDKSGFSGKMTVTWSANTDTNTSGYVIRWSSQNPATVTNPLWEYGQVDGKSTTTFEITGLTPNTTYYWQVTAKSPYNAISWASPKSGTLAPIIDPNSPADVFAQLRSVLSIGGKTADLFKIGTGITQDINTSITITPSLTTGTYNGIILNKSSTNLGHNYWLNTGQFRVGSATSFLYWNGSDLYTTGKINATGGSFTGDVQLNGGSLYAGALPNTGARVRINSSGIFAYDANNAQTVAITQSDGKIDARQGYVGGWTINGTAQTVGSISSSNTKIESNGTITLGDTSGTLASVIKLSATDGYRIWVGSQSSSAAAFKVSSAGKMYATGAVIDGAATISGTVTIGGTAASTVVSNASAGATAVQPSGTFNGTIGTSATVGGVNLNTRLSDAYTASQAALPKSGFNRDEIVKYINSTTSNPTNTTTIEGGLIRTGTLSADAVVTNFIAAFEIAAEKIKVGTLSGQRLVAGLTGTSYYLDTKGTKAGIECLVVNAIGIESTRTGGVTTHWYPYYPSSPNIDLGTVSFRWNDARLSGALMVGHNGSDNPATSVGPKTKLFADGTIFANTLGIGSGTSNIRQDAEGYLRYTSSSSRRYKNSIVDISTIPELDPYKLLDIPVRAFKYNESYLNQNDQRFNVSIPGFIAEEVQEVYPVAVDLISGEPETWVSNYMVPGLLALIQDIVKRLDALEG